MTRDMAFLYVICNNYIVGLKIFAACTGDSLFFGRKIIRTVDIFKLFCQRQKIIWVKEILLETVWGEKGLKNIDSTLRKHTPAEIIYCHVFCMDNLEFFLKVIDLVVTGNIMPPTQLKLPQR